MYGADRWERAYGATGAAEWVQALGAFTLDDLARGIERAERDDSGRLPTLGQFRMWCREFAPGTFAGNAPPSRTPLPALPDLAWRTKAGKAWLALMYLDGHLPQPVDVTADHLEHWMADCDIADMRRQVERERHAILGRMGVVS